MDLDTSSHEGELRDRIARAMFDADLCTGDASRTDWSWAQKIYEQSAKAIIDDLGLEVVSDGGRPEWKLQIVGKWENA